MKLSVLQWNVWYKESADNILQELKRLEADIVCLQELTTNSAASPRRDIPAEIAALGYNPYFVHSLHDDEVDMGNGIFSKLPISNARHVFVQHETPDSEDYSHENRIYLEVTVKTETGLFAIGTVHLSYTEEFLSTTEKDQETDRLIAAIEPNKERFVLTGDFNALPGSYTINALGKKLTSAGPGYDESTWTTKPFSYNGFEANKLEYRLDYVFTTPDIGVSDSRIIQTAASDHLPILTTIEI